MTEKEFAQEWKKNSKVKFAGMTVKVYGIDFCNEKIQFYIGNSSFWVHRKYFKLINHEKAENI